MESTSWHAYPKVYALGHAAIADLLLDDVIVQEKVDGSQFSMALMNGELKVRSRGHVMNVDAPDAMFTKAVEVAKSLDLHDGWTYRAEYIQKPRHNALKYNRIPTNHLIVFDINDAEESYLPYDEMWFEAARIGLECVPKFHFGKVFSASDVRGFLDRESVLGGPKVEGVVIKNYKRFGLDGKAMMGKFVSEAYKEIHSVEWKKANPQKIDIVVGLIDALRTEARWQKGLQHLAERGELHNDPKDIGPAIKEIQADVLEECTDEIKDALFKWVWPQIQRGVIRGFPEWFKQRLMEDQFRE